MGFCANATEGGGGEKREEEAEDEGDLRVKGGDEAGLAAAAA